MRSKAEDLTKQARALAARFDQSFALPRNGAVPVRHDFIAVRVRDDPHALRLLQLAELRNGTVITRLPGSGAELVGIANLRGAAVPVYDLGLLLGYPPGNGKPSWCALLAMAPVALAFDAFGGHLRLSAEASAARDETNEARPHIDQILRTSGQALPIIDLPSIVGVIARATGGPNAAQKGE
ncbi:chemotaxis protein CheW [Rhizorhapis sp.]|uniref:chemotaxis protein CheW n=1 Tax=Rhizorhapis sp. TaxID=1968842 RepID=UPI002B45B1D4|nr:chemotaxis protein CheW [Rhizorhapis sp.]HKR18016.1 chemotaxis protein CheW [Rhizorhapis sp.]